ncbi:unnamed protein product [Chilo suppressalis]|uniref:Cyclin-dependent kinase inhibitor domain-containing protein n=1 Tax=Chilo suppressalis TaxID=168631 RepID=A0ABN8AVC7_CHISP|nr:unnamed protein product [Chilo suppressalis]
MDRNPKPAICRQIFTKDGDDEEDLNNSIKIKEEILKDQNEFIQKYNYDPREDKPIPGMYEYSFDEIREIWIGRLSFDNVKRKSIEKKCLNTAIIETKDDELGDLEDKQTNDRNESGEKQRITSNENSHTSNDKSLD